MLLLNFVDFSALSAARFLLLNKIESFFFGFFRPYLGQLFLEALLLLLYFLFSLGLDGLGRLAKIYVTCLVSLKSNSFIK